MSVQLFDRIRITSQNPAYGARVAERVGGIFEPEAGTWLIPVGTPELKRPYENSWDEMGRVDPTCSPRMATRTSARRHEPNCPAAYGNGACECR